jgi:hypothetical protein
MSTTFFDWIRGFLSGRHETKTGAILILDYDFTLVDRLAFTGALISEISFPACDASSKDAATISLRFQPATLQKAVGGKAINVPRPAPKHWTLSNFRVAIQGLDCSQVNKVDSLQFSRHGSPPILAVTLAESKTKGFYDWHQDFVVKGNTKSEKTGTLTYLTSDLGTALFTLMFHNLGIFKVTPDKTSSGHENIRRVKAEMYTEHLDFKYSSGATWA